MVRFFKFLEGDKLVAINPSYVAHIDCEIAHDGSVITMCDGRRYYIDCVSATKLIEQLEMFANYEGI